MSLFQSIGTFDNLDEPTPFMNKKPVIYGFVITFLVSRGSLYILPAMLMYLLQTISTICATLRLYVRFFVTRCPGWDDYFIVVIFVWRFFSLDVLFSLLCIC